MINSVWLYLLETPSVSIFMVIFILTSPKSSKSLWVTLLGVMLRLQEGCFIPLMLLVSKQSVGCSLRPSACYCCYCGHLSFYFFEFTLGQSIIS